MRLSPRPDLPVGLADGPRWLAPLLVALALAALAYGCALWWPRTVDDAFIVFRHAQNLIEGHGPNFNPGERVEGYTCPTWMLALAAIMALGIDPVPASKFLGVSCSVALVLLAYRSMRRAGVVDWGAALAVVALGSSFVLQIWAVSGLETVAFALLLFASLDQLSRPDLTGSRILRASLALVASALTRPEGLAFWSLGIVAVASGASRPRRGALVRYALPGSILVAHFAWRLSYYGDWLPNTYYVKTGGGAAMVAQGWDRLLHFASSPAHVLWLAGAFAGAVVGATRRESRRSVAILSCATILQLAYIVSVGDDSLRVHRFYVPILAPLAFLLAQLFRPRSLVRLREKALAGFGMLAVLVTATASIGALRFDLAPSMRDGGLAYLEGNVKLGRTLKETRDPRTIIAVPSAGAIPFYSGLWTIDMYGLNDRHIARSGFSDPAMGPLMKWDNAYVIGKRPDLIVINRGYFRAGEALGSIVPGRPGILVENAMDRDLFERIQRDGGYALRRIDLGDGSMFYVFERMTGGT